MEYTGSDNLEAMKLAVNYNANLLSLVTDFSAGAKDVLDFGAGLGTYAEPVRDTGTNVWCFEIDDTMVESLKSKKFQVYTESQNVPSNAFDAIYSINVLEHTTDDLQILKSFHRWLRPGGKILIYVPAFMHLYSSMDKKVGHQRRYSRAELLEKVTQSGFTVQTCGYADSLGYFATVLYKLGGSSQGNINLSGLKIYDRFAFPLSAKLDHVFKHFFGKNLFLVATK